MPLKDYIQGKKRGKEANRLEREAMNDPFLQEALDGFESVAGDHAKIIEQLEEKYTRPTVALPSKKRRFLYWTAAASILFIIGFSAYLILEKNGQNIPAIAKTQPNENEGIISADSFAMESQAKIPQRKSEELPTVAKENKKTEQELTNSSATSADNSNSLSKNDVVTADTRSLSESSKSVATADKVMDREQEIEPIQEKKTANKSDTLYDTAAERSVAAKAAAQSSEANTFGEKEFQLWCQQKANKNVCNGNGATVKVSFFIDETGKPTEIEYKKYSCEEAKKEMGNLLSSSPFWTKTNRKVTMTIKW